MSSVDTIKTHYFEKYSQAVLLTLDGEVLESCNTLFVAEPKHLFVTIPFLASIKDVLLSMKLEEERTFACIDGSAFGQIGYFDFVFKRVIKDDLECTLWIIMDFSDHYKNVIVEQQQRNDTEIRNEYLELEQQNSKLEKKLLEYENYELQKIQELKTDFFSKISHEIRNPVNGIVGLVNLISQSKNAHKTSEYIESLKSVTGHMVSIVNDVLDLSKIESGKIEFESKAFDLRIIVRASINAFEFSCKEKGVRLSYLISPDLPKLLIGDSVKLSQILYNLLGNAVKFTNQGDINLEIRSLDTATNNYKVQFIITDSGIGIPEEQQSSIFDAYVQASSATSRIYGGTGLGLPIVKQFVELQGGDVSLESNVGEGTVFTVNLPFLLSEEDLSIEIVANEIDAISLRILIAEDDPINRQILHSFFEKWGHEPVAVENGQEALDELRLNKYDLIILDYNMPVKNGFEALKEARSNGITVPAYIFSGEVTEDFSTKFSVLDVIDFIKKPVDPESLKEVINSFVQGMKSRIPHQNPAVDTSSLQELLDNDLERVNEILDIFIEEMPKNISKMKMAFEASDWNDLKIQVHKAKSSFTYIGIPELTDLLNRLEDNLEKGKQMETYGLVLNKVERTVNMVIVQLKRNRERS